MSTYDARRAADELGSELNHLGPAPEPSERLRERLFSTARRTAWGMATAADLMREDLPPIRYVVPSYFAEGLTLLGGKPKQGKSWLLLGTAIAVAMGGVALGSV